LAPGESLDDVDHTQATGLDDWDGGLWDQWIPAKGPETMAYYTCGLIPFHFALANAYTICDNYFCSLIGPTYPNRLFLFTGTIDPNWTGGGPALANNVPPGGFTWTTYPERLQAAGISWRVYRPVGDWFGDVLPWFAQYINANPGDPLYDCGVAMVPDVLAAFLSDITNGSLPQVSWIIPPSISDSEHPPGLPSDGAFFIKGIMDAIATNSAVFNSTIFILTYDENGGFFDHIPSPTPPPGTPDEFVAGEPVGLGVRVPMIIASPWSQGGRVCSQIFDHTSIIRFLETWTGVEEPNISAWRRQVCGDLTSAFDFANPETNYPALPNLTSLDADTFAGTPPNLQSMPQQDTNSLVSMPLPYQPEVVAETDCASGQIFLAMTNGGSASVHLAVHANFAQTDPPWQFDVNSNQCSTNSFAVSELDTNTYDFTCYGPNGFQRRFAGSLQNDCDQIEASSSIDTNFGIIILTMQNFTTNAVQFVITDGYGMGGPWTNAVPDETTGAIEFPAVASNDGWYDLTVTANSDPAFLRQFTGRIETGSPSATEPVLAPVPPIEFSSVMNAASINSLLGNLVNVPPTNALPLYVSSAGQNLVLIYPAWASNYAVESSPIVAPACWSPLSATLSFASNYILVSAPTTSSNMFFRLRQ
jgi:phospholipase C